MLTQYNAMTVSKIEERKEDKERKLSLRTSLLLKASFEAVSKPQPKPSKEKKNK